MIKKHVLLSILGLFIACTVGAQDNSMADEKAIVKSGNMRFTRNCSLRIARPL